MALQICSAPIARKLPVLIVGGGLGGFTAALSLHRAGIRNNIITKESKFTEQARSGVFLAGSAIRILDRLGLGSKYRAFGTPMHLIEVEDRKGRNIISIRLDDLGAEIWTVPRANLQQTFLESIPSDSVHFNTKFRALQMNNSEVRVRARTGQVRDDHDASQYLSLFGANFVVGADGHNSSVRNFMSRSAMTVASGVSLWRAVVQNRNVAEYPFHVGKEIWDGDKRFGHVRMNPDEVVWWALIFNFHEILLRPFKPRLLREFERFPKSVAELISSVESDRAITRTEMKNVWPENVPWVDPITSQVALVGDAARPGHFGNFHSGYTFAVEDGYSLANYLADQNERGLLETGPDLQGYAENRQERMDAVKKYFVWLDRLSTSQSPIPRYFAKMMFRISVQRMALEGGGLGSSGALSRQLTV